jgi:hypothetical protein
MAKRKLRAIANDNDFGFQGIGFACYLNARRLGSSSSPSAKSKKGRTA